MFHRRRFACTLMITTSVLASLGFGGGAGQQSPTGPPASESARPKRAAAPAPTRLPAVAGLFYPKDREELSKTLDGLLGAAPAQAVPNVKALICPHAGYAYSGPVAARAYRTIAGREFRTVVIVAASHYAEFRGVSVAGSAAYETPLGTVPVSEQVRRLAQHSPFVLEPKCFVQRPQWASLSSKLTPPVGDDTPETWEHSVEVQVPFLQKTLKDFTLLPVVYGDADPEQVAQALADILDDQTLVVASTDLSHYHSYSEAKALDQQTVQWICQMDIKALQSPAAAECACGRLPVLTLLHLARLKGWTPQLLDCRNSGDTSGDRGRVVGYAAIAFTGPASRPAPAQEPFAEAEKKFLLDLARETLRRVVAQSTPPEVNPDSVPARLREPKGCFVTLTKDGELRGCVGNVVADDPLCQAVMHNAESAALRDPRFPPVTAEELRKLRIEISVLTEPQPLTFRSPDDLLSQLQPRRHGIVLKIGGRSATFLPQVWSQIPDKVEFLGHLSQKAGCPPSAWRGPDVTASTFQVEAFAEPE